MNDAWIVAQVTLVTIYTSKYKSDRYRGGCNGLPVAGEGRAGARGDEGEYRMSGILEDINLTRQGEIKG